jgi:hypothetical protein
LQERLADFPPERVRTLCTRIRHDAAGLHSAHDRARAP